METVDLRHPFFVVNVFLFAIHSWKYKRKIKAYCLLSNVLCISLFNTVVIKFPYKCIALKTITHNWTISSSLKWKLKVAHLATLLFVLQHSIIYLKTNTRQLVRWLLIVFSLIKQCHVGSIRTVQQVFLFSNRNMCHCTGCLAFKPIA